MQLADSATFLLRQLAIHDTATIARLADYPDVADAMMSLSHPVSAAAVRQYLQDAAQLEIDGLARFFAVESAGQLVGGVSLLRIDRQHSRAELRVWIGRPFWGRGLATSAGFGVLKYAFDDLGLNRVQAVHLARNVRIAQVLTKLGFTREGLLREHLQRKGSFEDVVLYGLLASVHAGASNG